MRMILSLWMGTLLLGLPLGAQELKCPEGTVAVGFAPPEGLGKWCESDDGAKHGKWVKWYPSGQVMVDGEYQKGKQHGIWTHWSGITYEITTCHLCESETLPRH